jgi:hypothetical protein
MESNEGDFGFKNLFILANTYRDRQQVTGGFRLFRQDHVLSKGYVSKIDEQHILRDYIRTFGTTVFDSQDAQKPIYTAFPDMPISLEMFAQQFWKSYKDVCKETI